MPQKRMIEIEKLDRIVDICDNMMSKHPGTVSGFAKNCAAEIKSIITGQPNNGYKAYAYDDAGKKLTPNG